MVNIDLLFVGLIIFTYFSLFRNFSLFKSALIPFNLWEFDKKLDRLKKSTAFIDKVIIFSLTKTKNEFQYIYFSKIVIMILAVIFVPWFVIVYFMKWYYIPTFFWSQFTISLFLRMPSFVFSMILDAYNRRCK